MHSTNSESFVCDTNFTLLFGSSKENNHCFPSLELKIWHRKIKKSSAMATTATKQPQKKNASLSVGTKAIIKTGHIPCIIVKARAKMEWTVQIVDENGSPTQDEVDCTSQMLLHIRRHKGEILLENHNHQKM